MFVQGLDLSIAYMEVMYRWYDSREGIGKIESGTETENNPGSHSSPQNLVPMLLGNCSCITLLHTIHGVMRGNLPCRTPKG